MGTLYQQSLGRDVMGRITGTYDAVQGTAVVHGYRYDDPGRLYGVTTGADTVARYWYDANGNRIAVWTASGIDTATYDDQDRLLSYGHLSAGYARYSYTNNGDLTQKVSPQGTTRYTYDALGNLTGAHLPSGDSLVYLIDGENRRVERKLNGSLQKAWLYENALSPVAELDGTGALVSRFVYGTQPNVPEYLVKSGVTYRIVTDQLGSVRLVVSAADGSIAQRLDYDAWGNVITDTSPGFQPFGYAGGLYDPDTKLVRFGARDYDASAGRWTCKDPVVLAGRELNLYWYAADNPVGYLDPVGLEFISPEERKKIPPKAAGWGGTPYQNRAGKNSRKGVGADCSGAVWGIYGEAGFPYDYSPTSTFPQNTHFRKIPDQTKPQPGDVGWWNGHMVIYDPNAGRTRQRLPGDSWSAHHQGGPPFGPAQAKWFEGEYGQVTWYRYWRDPCQCEGTRK